MVLQTDDAQVNQANLEKLTAALRKKDEAQFSLVIFNFLTHEKASKKARELLQHGEAIRVRFKAFR